MTYADFTTAYPEFDTMSAELVEAKLSLARKRVSEETYGDRHDEAVGLMAAHLLWTSPFGASTRLDGGDKEASNRYWDEFVRLRREVCPTIIVT